MYGILISPNLSQYCSESTSFYFTRLLFQCSEERDPKSIEEIRLYIGDIISYWHGQRKLHHQGKIRRNV